MDSPLSSVYPLNVPATCGKCHGDADYMEGIDLETNQLVEYASSVHGVALLEHHDIGAPACNDCHGNHGAAPPEAGSIANVCGNCHVNNQQLFEQSHLRTFFEDERFPLCVVCHEKHAIAKPTDDFLNWDGSTICRSCHEDGDEAEQMSRSFFNIIDSLRTEITVADSLIHRVEMKGLEVSDLQVAMEDAHRSLIKSRTTVHAFSEELLRETAAEGQQIATVSIAGARELLDHLRFRRRGLFAATLIITFMVVLIWMKVRQIESGDRD